MTTLVSARSTITTYFNTNWGTTTAVSWPNKAFTEPTDGSSWVQFNINFGNSLIKTVSLKNNDQLGIVLINIFTKRYGGTIADNTLADSIKALFNRKILSNEIFFEAPEVRDIPTPTDSNWFQTLVRIPFSFNEYIA